MPALISLSLGALLLLATGSFAIARAESEARYIANAGVMIVSGETKVVFDPLFSEDFDQYDLVPADTQKRMITGAPPFDAIDAVFVSHSHDDHFDPQLMLEFLHRNEEVRFFGPDQAMSALRDADAAAVDAVSDRLNVVSPQYGAAPVEFRIDGMHIAAIRIPHDGWPDYMSDVENIAFSVILDSATTVVHLGDADSGIEHFQNNGEFWRARHHHLALPPYWFFIRAQGKKVLEESIAADHAIGVHVPTRMPDDPQSRPLEFAGFDLFTRPGEIRHVKRSAP